jgi:signal transduction histidine kinase
MSIQLQFSIYFIYGLSFFVLGVSAYLIGYLKQSYSLYLNSIIELSLFGFMHAIFEWLTMYDLIFIQQHNHTIMLLSLVFMGWSYLALLSFGLSLLKTNVSDQQNRNSFIIGIAVAMMMILVSIDYNFLQQQYNLIIGTMRITLGFPAAVVTFVGYKRFGNQNIRVMGKSLRYAYYGLGFLFLLYGIFAGLVIENQTFFPFDRYNVDTFYAITQVPLPIIRTLLAIGIMINFVYIYGTILFESNQRIYKLLDSETQEESQQQMMTLIHDKIIQDLYSTSFRVSEILYLYDHEQVITSLKTINQALETAIKDLRSIIQNNEALICYRFSLLEAHLESFIEKHQQDHGYNISIKYASGPLSNEAISSTAVDHLYHSIQELVWNAIKHAQGTTINIIFNASQEALIIEIIDDGRGFKLRSKHNHFGLKLIRNRMSEMGGMVHIKSNRLGTKVKLIIPWEGMTCE